MWGTLTEKEMPWTQFKVSPMTVRLKPNGAARIIMDLSWPHERALGDGKAISVNAGMSDWESFEDTKMTGVLISGRMPGVHGEERLELGI